MQRNSPNFTELLDKIYRSTTNGKLRWVPDYNDAKSFIANLGDGSVICRSIGIGYELDIQNGDGFVIHSLSEGVLFGETGKDSRISEIYAIARDDALSISHTVKSMIEDLG